MRTIIILSLIILSSVQLSAETVSVSIPAGSLNDLKWNETKFTVRAPKLRDFVVKKAAVPGNWNDKRDDWIPWASWPKKTAPLTLKPKDPNSDTISLGPLYRTIIPYSVEITKGDGSKAKAGEDYRFNDDWGMFVAVNDRLGKAQSKTLTVKCQYRYQRLDLVQIDKNGTLSVKEGTASLHCPALPTADNNKTAIASIYVHPFFPEEGKPYSIEAKYINFINPKPLVAPVNPDAINNAKKLLEEGKEISIAFLGDSITLGAEAGPWWDDRSKTYTGKFVAGLNKKYPNARIKEIAAYKGGITTEKGAEFFVEKVKPQSPDLLLIALGGNDAAGSVKKGAKIPAPEFKEAIKKMVVEAKAANTEVIIVAPFPMGRDVPTSKNILKHVQVLKDLANEEQVAFADVHGEWMQMGHRGVPWYSQLNNWVNHPGEYGHTIYAEVLLEFFNAN